MPWTSLLLFIMKGASWISREWFDLESPNFTLWLRFLLINLLQYHARYDVTSNFHSAVTAIKCSEHSSSGLLSLISHQNNVARITQFYKLYSLSTAICIINSPKIQREHCNLSRKTHGKHICISQLLPWHWTTSLCEPSELTKCMTHNNSTINIILCIIIIIIKRNA